MFYLILLLKSFIIYTFYYESLVPSFIFILILFLIQGLTKFFNFKSKNDKNNFFKLMIVYYFMSSISVIFLKHFSDKLQLTKDAFNFYQLSTSNIISLNIFEISMYSEGSLAIYIWKIYYRLFDFFGINTEMYIGIYLNIFILSSIYLIVMKITRIIFNERIDHSKRVFYLFSFCGVYYLFSSLHFRDSFILLIFAINILFSLSYLQKPNSSFNLLNYILVSLLLSFCFFFLRKEFVFIPLVLATVNILLLTTFKNSGISIVSKLLLLVSSLFVFSFIILANNNLITYLIDGYLSYSNESNNNSSSSSLGLSLIVNQPFIVRAILGFAYMFIFPMPFWSGLTTDSAYYFFKSLNVLYLYVLFPFFILCILNILNPSFYKNKYFVFLLITSVGFTLSVVMTSLESRHFGIFIVLFQILSLYVKINTNIQKSNFLTSLIVYILFISVLHTVWLMLKVI